ncbi:uncharacterized protein LOC131659661 [Vicia villosa]|uniref:uncharacterized protein LOC131659661 n=1 Tax=Vicia villosa TaxID=3911 RepID=UPI00273ACD51|nr:uncharacterized protein LOC131659661 [Vicia villosa]
MEDEVLYLCDPEPAASASSTDSCSDLTQYFVTDTVLEWARAIGRTHGVVVVTILFDSSNGMPGRKDKLIMGCDRGGNYKKKNEVAAPSDGNSTMRLRCPFRLRSTLNVIGWKVVVKCEMHNHILDKDMLGHDILGRLKYDERKFVNDMTKYNMAPRYRLPLLEIVGVTSTKLTFLVAFAYLEQEREENLTWALERLKELFYSEKFLPDVMVTDWELALMNAIDSKDKNMMYSNIEDEFDVHLNHLESVCGDIPSFVKYVKETWLAPYKERFVAAWTNRVNHLENTTTYRVESARWRLKNMLTTSRGDLCASWEAVNTMLKLQLGSIRVTFQKKYEVSPDEEKWDLEEECEELKRKFSTMNIVDQRALKKKVCDISYPSTSSMCPPPVKYKPKSVVKKSRKGGESDVHRRGVRLQRDHAHNQVGVNRQPF